MIGVRLSVEQANPDLTTENRCVSSTGHARRTRISYDDHVLGWAYL